MYKTKNQHLKYLLLTRDWITEDELAKETGASKHTVHNNLRRMITMNLVTEKLFPINEINFTYKYRANEENRGKFLAMLLKGTTASRDATPQFKLVTNHTVMKMMLVLEHQDCIISALMKITNLGNEDCNRYMMKLELAGWVERKGYFYGPKGGRCVIWGITEEGIKYCGYYKEEWKGVFT